MQKFLGDARLTRSLIWIVPSGSPQRRQGPKHLERSVIRQWTRYCERYRELGLCDALRLQCNWCLNIAQLGAIPPPPFLSVSLLESMRSGGAIPPPPQKGYLSDTCAIPYENKANWCDTPLCDTISKGYCAIGGAISHWAAKTPWSFVISSDLCKLDRLALQANQLCPCGCPQPLCFLGCWQPNNFGGGGYFSGV